MRLRVIPGNARLLSNCDSHDEAAAAYGQLVELYPDWIDGHRHLSGALAAAGQVDEAIVSAIDCTTTPSPPSGIERS